MADEGVPAGLHLDIGEGHSLLYPTVPVDDGEEVPEPLLGDQQRAHDVHVYMGEPLLGHWDWLHGGGRLAGHFGPGTGLAVLHPLCHVLVH